LNVQRSGFATLPVTGSTASFSVVQPTRILNYLIHI
jgi:hypothetical protein